ncbi:MAG: hypothetical protein DRN68_03440 [Thaumarchaeota archaeon]|nr:MAG: hypothetical protein DRN68_03440 [Nitrososphaerota archaeon]
MRIWFDILSPKQLFLFTSLAKTLKDLGHEPIMTSRHYIQLDNLLERISRDWNIAKIGSWGGGTLEGKLRASIDRLKKLLDYIIERKPDMAFSSGSVEASRISYGLGIPHILISDTPHSPVNRLVAPISEKVLTPWIISDDEWINAGAHPRKIRHYRALDPCFWLRDFTPSKDQLREFGLKEDEYILLRMPETMASYLRIRDESFLDFIENLVKVLDELRLVILCRYSEQSRMVHRTLKDEKILVIDRPIFGQSLIYYSSIFIGGGGTMTQEAALLGVPAISIYPRELPTAIKFLVENGLVLYYSSPEQLLRGVRKVLEKRDVMKEEFRARAESLWKIMEDPKKRVIDEVFT